MSLSQISNSQFWVTPAKLILLFVDKLSNQIFNQIASSFLAVFPLYNFNAFVKIVAFLFAFSPFLAGYRFKSTPGTLKSVILPRLHAEQAAVNPNFTATNPNLELKGFSKFWVCCHCHSSSSSSILLIKTTHLYISETECFITFVWGGNLIFKMR